MAYFGTDGCPGHCFKAISGNFTQEEIYEFERIDCNDKFERLFHGKFCFKFFIYQYVFGCLAFNASPDDKRNGSKTVFFVEGAKNEKEVLYSLKNAPFVKHQFQKLAEIYSVEMPKYNNYG